MKVQRIQNSEVPYRHTWTVVGHNYLPIPYIDKYLRFLEITKSINTVRTYAQSLKLFCEFIECLGLDCQKIDLSNLSEFIHWLRAPQPGVTNLQPQEAKRSERTINLILAAVCSLYEFHERIQELDGPKLYRHQFQLGRTYKPLLYHISKGKAIKRSLIKLKEPKTFPGILHQDQVQMLLEACNQTRDKFLLALLYEAGIRIGEALGLRHEDIHSTGENEVHIIPRSDNVNGAQVKSNSQRIVHVSKELMRLYADYLIDEYPSDIDCDYVFVNLRDKNRGYPMTYTAVNSLFRRLCKKTGIKVNPHLFRHTHATQLIEGGWDMPLVQERLGHANVQTTINTYAHLSDEYLKQSYKDYISNREFQGNLTEVEEATE